MDLVNLGDDAHYMWRTVVPTTGVPATWDDTPRLGVYEDNSTSNLSIHEYLSFTGQISVDFDGATGLNHVLVSATAANGYEEGKTYHLVVTGGNAGSGGVSEVGRVVGSFKIPPKQLLRVNKPAGPAYRLKASSRHDGTYKTDKPIRLRPGAVDVAVGVDMSQLFGREFVSAVGAPTAVGLSSVTASVLGPRDTEAMIQLGGTATADDVGTVEQLVTMDNGDAVLVTFDVRVFPD